LSTAEALKASITMQPTKVARIHSLLFLQVNNTNKLWGKIHQNNISTRST